MGALDSTTAIVTGSSRGIGAEVAKLLAAQGAAVVVNYRQKAPRANKVVAGIEEVRARGEGPLAQLFDLMFFGDVTTLHLAYDAGVDPGPIAVLQDMKARQACPDRADHPL